MPSVYEALSFTPSTMEKCLAPPDAMQMHVSKIPFSVKNRKVRHSASEPDTLPAGHHLTGHSWLLLASRKAAEHTQDTGQDLVLESSGSLLW